MNMNVSRNSSPVIQMDKTVRRYFQSQGRGFDSQQKLAIIIAFYAIYRLTRLNMFYARI